MAKILSKSSILIVTLILVYAAFIFSSDLTKIYESIMKIQISHLTIAIILWISGNLIKSIRWHYFSKAVDIKIPFKKNFQYYLAGLAFSVTPGRVGEILRGPYIKRDYGVSISKTASIVFTERFYDLIGLIIILTIGLSLTEFDSAIILVPIIILILIIIILKNKNNLLKILNLLSKIKLFKNLNSNFDESYNTIIKLMKIKFFLFGCGISASSYFLFSAAVYFLISGLGASISFQEIMKIFPTSQFIAILSFIPAGIGIFEGGMIGLLTLSGVEYEISISATILIRIIATGIISLIGLYFLRIISKPKSIE